MAQALQKSLVGEQFTGYLHVTNTNGQTVHDVGLKVEIDIGALAQTMGRQHDFSRESSARPAEYQQVIVDTVAYQHCWIGQSTNAKSSQTTPGGSTLPPANLSSAVMHDAGQPGVVDVTVPA